MPEPSGGGQASSESPSTMANEVQEGWCTKYRWTPEEAVKTRTREVFVSFKSHDETGQETKDSVIAKTVAAFLRGRGFSVFLSLDSLEQLGKSAYMEAIEAALESANVLIAIGTRAEYLTSQWVKYEWHSFHQEIVEGRKVGGEIFSIIEGVTPQSLPLPLRQRQVFSFTEDGLHRLGGFVKASLARQTNRRLPLYVLADCSSSMQGDPRKSLDTGIRALTADIRSDAFGVETVWISLIAFAADAWPISPLTSVRLF